MPVTTRPLDIHDEWLNRPLGSRVNYFDRLAYEGFTNTVEKARECTGPERKNEYLEFVESFTELYQEDLKKYIPNIK